MQSKLRDWFDAEMIWDNDVAGARNVFMKIGIGAMHLYDQPPRDLGRNAVHHLGMKVVGLAELYERMKAGGLHIPNPIRDLGGGGGYFMLGGPDGAVIEVFEPGRTRDKVVQDSPSTTLTSSSSMRPSAASRSLVCENLESIGIGSILMEARLL